MSCAKRLCRGSNISTACGARGCAQGSRTAEYEQIAERTKLVHKRKKQVSVNREWTSFSAGLCSSPGKGVPLIVRCRIGGDE